MYYKKIYEELIQKRIDNPVNEKEYHEIHHIVPRSCGGSDNKNNLIGLTAREHLIAHKLLFRIYDRVGNISNKSRMARAVLLMSRNPHKIFGFEYPLTSREHQKVKESLKKIKLIRTICNIIVRYGNIDFPKVRIFPVNIWNRVMDQVRREDYYTYLDDIVKDFEICCRMADMEIHYGTYRFKVLGREDIIGFLKTLQELSY